MAESQPSLSNNHYHTHVYSQEVGCSFSEVNTSQLAASHYSGQVAPPPCIELCQEIPLIIQEYTGEDKDLFVKEFVKDTPQFAKVFVKASRKIYKLISLNPHISAAQIVFYASFNLFLLVFKRKRLILQINGVN